MSTQKRFEHKGKTYYANQRGHKISVITEKTANGQMIHLGCYDTDDKTWQCSAIIPKIVKKGVELTFGMTNA